MEESRELVRQAKKGKREAFAKLYETVYEDMYRFALYVLKDREDAEDAVAEKRRSISGMDFSDFIQ